MNKLLPQTGALAHMSEPWPADRVEAALAGVGRKRSRRAAVRVGGTAAMLVVMIGGAHAFLSHGEQSSGASSSVVAAESAKPGARNVEPGYRIEAIDEHAVVELQEEHEHRVEVRVVQGKSRFDVAHRPARAFRVASGEVHIRVYGSVFSAARYEDITELWVETGHLVIEYQGTEQKLLAGQHVRLGPDQRSSPPSQSADSLAGNAARSNGEKESAHPTPSARQRRQRAVVKKEWRTLADQGDYDGAYKSMRDDGPVAVRDHVDDLLLAADVARLSRHPKQALRPLKRVVAKYSSDTRAPTAAFTLARILLDDLGQARAAARYFRIALDLNPSGPLAEDALAREVEALARDGQEESARDRARLYLQRFPAGHRARAVQAHTEL